MLNDVAKAISIERKNRYINIQGKRSTFSAFIVSQFKQFEKYLDLPTGKTHQSSEKASGDDVYQINPLFQQYPFMDVGRRRQAIERLESCLKIIVEPFQPTSVQSSPKSSQNNTSSSAEPVIELTGEGLRGQPVSAIKGVGPSFVKRLALLDIHSVHDVLHYYPKRYLDYQQQVPINQLQVGQDVTIVGTISSVSLFQPKGRRLMILTLSVTDGLGRIQAQWFYNGVPRAVVEGYKRRFAKGAMVMMSGRVKEGKGGRGLTMDRPEVELLDMDTDGLPQSIHAGRIVPVYPLTEGVYLKGLRRVIHQALEQFAPLVVDPFPESIIKDYELMDLPSALRAIHFPDALDSSDKARRRIVFDEFFYLQARLAMVRAHYKQVVAGAVLKPVDGGVVDQFTAELPFKLTGAQSRVMAEIKADLGSYEPMYRLLQGDVGSGKTLVALLSLLMGVDNKFQGALMAPTEILAEQHYKRFVEWLTPLGLKVGLCLGKQKVKERREIHQGLLNGQIHLAVGTHALIQDGVEFQNLGVVVIDEQHRFGVRQRMQLKAKGNHPHMLTMTATPIPRTLAMTLHGDLEVSVLDELPPGRTPIETTLYTPSQRKKAYEWMTTEIVRGRQAYIVYPLVEESETLAAKAATSEAKRLQEEVFPQWRVGLLHGKMKPDEKETVMARFAAGDTHILVSTTVVEVGVDVPNASIMMIENADRFGLSQLHQLRGRVGRGQHASYCFLVSDTSNPDTIERLNVMERTTDGFEISEKDLEIRGPGEFLGTRQSGLPEFKLADLVTDQNLLSLARQAAFDFVNDGENLLEYPKLREEILENTAQVFQLLSSG
jgi:ATP-dependent DNA helicase RecG